MMRSLLALLLSGIASAANIPITLVGSTATQAVIRYKASNSAACTLTGSFDFGGTTHNLYDLNATLFPNADQDLSRSTTLADGLRRTVVLGSRSGETASDGKIYSRALPAAAGQMPELSRITVGVSCNGGADTGSIQFSTRNIPIGATNPEPPPFNSDGFGNYGWPTIDWTDRDAIYIDPMTGLILKRMTGPGDGFGSIATNQSFAFVLDPNGSWTNDNNALNGSGGPYASTSGTAPLFLGYPEILPEGANAGGWGIRAGVDDVNVTIHGSCDGATAADRTIEVAHSMLDSGNTLDGSTLSVVMGTSEGSQTVLGTFPAGLFEGWGFVPSGDWLPSKGTLNASGTSITALGTSACNYFNIEWKAGAKIKISGSGCANEYCEIASVQSATQATLVENIGTLSGATWLEAAPGIVIRKQNATGTCNVSARFDRATSVHFTYDLNGATDRCSQVEVTVSTDKAGDPAGPWQGYICLAGSSGVQTYMYLVIPETGEVRLIDDAFKVGGGQPAGAPAGDQVGGGGTLLLGHSGFSTTAGNEYFFARTVDGGNFAIIKITYTGDYREHVKYARTTQEFTFENQTRSDGTGTVNDQIDAKAAADGDPIYNPAIWTQIGISAQGAPYQLFSNRPVGGVQDEAIFYSVFNVNTGLITNQVNTFNGSHQRWNAAHTSGGTPFWMINAGHFLKARNPTHYMGGPFMMDVEEVLISGAWDTVNTALSATYAEACEAEIVNGPHWSKLDPNVEGSPGTNRCVSIRTDGEPCSRWPRTSSNEHLDFPCPHNASWSMVQTLEEGDFISDPCANNTLPIDQGCDAGFGGAGTNEKFLVAKKTALSDNRLELRLVRWATCDKHVGESPSANHKDNWQVQMWPSQHCGGNNSWIHPTDPSQNLIPEYWQASAGHNDFGQSQYSRTSGDRVFITSAGTVRFGAVPDSFGKTVEESGFLVELEPKWAGINTGLDGVPPLQSYPSKRQWTAPDHEQRWYLDLRHYNPSAGSGPEIPSNSYPITCSLQGGTSQTYRCNNPVGVFSKTHPYFARSGRYTLRDISAPSTLRDWVALPFGDSDIWAYCVPRVDGECRSGSVAGSDAYLNIPHLSTDVAQCRTNMYATNYPCFDSGSAVGAWVTQRDITRADPEGTRMRRLTMGFSGPGRQYHFANARATPDGKYMMIPGFWLDGARMDTLLAKLPPWPEREDQTTDRSTFVPFEVRLGPAPAASKARVRFGYAENGSIDNFFCTSRRETCVVGVSTPYDFEQTDTVQPAPCSTGCRISVPVLPGRVLYYQTQRVDDSGLVISSGPIEVAAVP